jgi:hypothetical protein
MSDTNQATDDTPDTETAVPPAPVENSFTALLELLKLVNDAKAVEARLSELRKEGRQIARARVELSQEQSRHAEAVRRERAEIEQERAALAAREKAVNEGEVQVEAMLAVLRGPASPYARLEMLPSGGAREPDDEMPSRASDPHFGRHSVTASDDEMVLEKVGSASTTLTRSVPVPRPRKSMKRVQPNV